MKKVLSIVSLVLIGIVLLYRISQVRKMKEMNNTLASVFPGKTAFDPAAIHYTDIYGFPERIKLMYQNNQRAGLYDSVVQKIILPMKYDDISCFGSESATTFKQNEKYGILDTLGNEIIPAIYDYATSFYEGLAQVKLNGKVGYINRKNEVVIPIKYEYGHDFYSDRAAVKLNNKWGFIDHSGKYRIKPIYDDVVWPLSELHPKAKVGIKGHYTLIDKNGKFLVNTDGEFLESE